MSNRYTGPERRANNEEREGRRVGDQRCPDHHLLWKHHDEDKINFREGVEKHQDLACGKIRALEAFHIRDVGEVKNELDKKADKTELKPIVNSVRNLIVIGCLVVGSIMSGALIWIKADLSTIAPAIQRLNVRITESVNDRVAIDIEQTKKLGVIEGQLSTVNWRLSQIEEVHKPINKFTPESKGTKPN